MPIRVNTSQHRLILDGFGANILVNASMHFCLMLDGFAATIGSL
jgi:hypothetical protein